ncbi:tRNA-uridine aminocarboxypropyltransferase 2-like [Macrobrachium nipponense]|uniref:tRNA-uridine aminocarboxypropyltransferase 2-like n=1 Tax=Macrobrachium nipponense TaxID=159736 RepID=UPI0030C83B05
MDNEEQELAQMADLVHIEIGRREKRPLCNRCSRPVGVCWCSSLGCSRVQTSCRVVILQHPHEEKRCLRTAPILQAGLPQGAYVEAKGKRFSFTRFPHLEEILTNENSILMYPGEKALDLESLLPVGNDQPSYNIIIIDGTWQQAKSIYHNCRHLHSLRQVKLSGKYISEYVIRTQPTEDALSTVETAAIALATLENNWSIYDTLVQPLQLLCQYQMNHGAVPHQSKEHMIVSGRYKKPLGKRTYKKLRKCGAKQDESLSDFLESLNVADSQKEESSDLDVLGNGEEANERESNNRPKNVSSVLTEKEGFPSEQEECSSEISDTSSRSKSNDTRGSEEGNNEINSIDDIR